MDVMVGRVRGFQRGVGRISPAALVVRAGVFLVVLAGLALAYPAEVLSGRPLAFLAFVALTPAVGPRRVWPTFAALVTVGGWVLATDGYDRPVTLWRLLALAALLYLGHTLCALAALLPYDAVVDPELITRWLLRAGAVLLGAAVLGVLLLQAAGIGGDTGHQWATVLGLLVAVGLSALLGWLLRRR
ncbi:LPXTG cell wall anchor domain-containing protein [Micromonospora sp. GCM10011542]|uniref:LPXTG cell wall anchor domain-containing protein n=1 Tax=Micromonospora sp. GCM10011542 TaxID=3317337 RepID=UPI0036224A93